MGNDENTLQIREDRCVRQPAIFHGVFQYYIRHLIRLHLPSLIDVDFITPQEIV